MKFSIIIPAHNSQDFIETALGSVVEQCFTDYELIVVCDACTDRTKKIAEFYADKVLEVDYHNDGLTRNAGMDVAEGDWILFMDDDDRWLHEYVLTILDKACRYNADVVAFGFIFKSRGPVGPLMDGAHLWPNVWSKAWRREYVQQFRFKNIPMESDLHFCADALPGARVRLVDGQLYLYNYMRPGSQTELKNRMETHEG